MCLGPIIGDEKVVKNENEKAAIEAKAEQVARGCLARSVGNGQFAEHNISGGREQFLGAKEAFC